VHANIDPDSNIRNKPGLTPLETTFIDNQHEILQHTINSNYEDPNLQINSKNIARLIDLALEFQAKECLEILLKHYHSKIKSETEIISFSEIFMQ